MADLDFMHFYMAFNMICKILLIHKKHYFLLTNNMFIYIYTYMCVYACIRICFTFSQIRLRDHFVG